jgi:6,7-dimethyl-8-ribityllumazine synthase
LDQIIQSKRNEIAFIKARWHAEIVDRCEDGFMAELDAQGRGETRVHTFEVPGAFDIPLLAKKLAQSGKYGAIIAAGFVVDGGIYRHDFVAAAVIDGLMQVQLETGVPVISSVLTPHQFHETETHKEFFRAHFVEKGKEAASACLQIVENLGQLETASA